MPKKRTTLPKPIPEARTVTYIWEADPQKPASAARQQQAMDAVRRHMLEVGNEQPQPRARIRWAGTAYELARKVRDELARSGQDITKRGVFTTGLEKACAEYENSKGNPFTPKVLRDSLRQWELKNT